MPPSIKPSGSWLEQRLVRVRTGGVRIRRGARGSATMPGHLSGPQETFVSILLLTSDGSEQSMTIVPHARRFAEALGLTVQVLRVIDKPAQKRGSQTDIVAEVRAQLMAQLDGPGKDWPIEVRVQESGRNAQQTITGLALEMDAAALAMHTRGTTALRHAVMGSVATDVLRSSGLPVLVSGDHCAAPPPVAGSYHIVIAVDGSPASREATLRVGDLIAGRDLQVTLLRVHVPAIGDRGEPAEIEEARRQVEDLLQYLPAGLTARAVAVSGVELERVETTVCRVARELNADVLACGTHGRSALKHVFLGSVANGIVAHSTLPVLLVRTVD